MLSFVSKDRPDYKEMKKVYSVAKETREYYEYLLGKAIELSGINEQFLLTTRERPAILYRYSIYYIMRKKGCSFVEIGAVAGFKHSTIMHAFRYVEDCIEVRTDKALLKILENMKQVTAEFRQPETIRTTERTIIDWLNENKVPTDAKNRLLSTLYTLRC